MKSLTKKKQEGALSEMGQERWLEAKAELAELHLEEIRRARLQSRALSLKPEASPGFFFRTLKIKRRREVIASIEDEKGKIHKEPNGMANLMLNHLEQIIGQPEGWFPECQRG